MTQQSSPSSTASCPTGSRRRPARSCSTIIELDVDIGFHEFEIGAPQRLLVTVEVWVDERSFAASDERGRRLGL